jgi:hypothetical protein
VRDVHHDKLQDSCSRKYQERPLDRPDASVRGSDGGVHDAMGMAVRMVLVMRAEAKPVQDFRNHAPPRYGYLLPSLDSSQATLSSHYRPRHYVGLWHHADIASGVRLRPLLIAFPTTLVIATMAAPDPQRTLRPIPNVAKADCRRAEPRKATASGNVTYRKRSYAITRFLVAPKFSELRGAQAFHVLVREIFHADF